MTTKQSLLTGAALGIALAVGRVWERESTRQSTAPATVAVVDSTVVYRAILVPPPKPDTSLRYLCSEAK